MQICEAVADGLAARGHQIAVLTSTYRSGIEIARPYPVHRLLEIDPDWHSGVSAARQFFVDRRRRERYAIETLQRLSTQHAADCIFVWHAAGLPRAMLQVAEQTLPTVYYLAGYLPEFPDEYIAYWEAAPVSPSAKILKRSLAKFGLAMLKREGKPIPLKYEHVICVSEYVRKRLVDQNLISKHSVVAHNGVDLSLFAPSAGTTRPSPSGVFTCLIAGRVVADKGIHTVIDALALLGEESRSFKLSILGDGPPDYAEQLRAQVGAHGLQDGITFHPPVPHVEMPRVLEKYDVLLLPSQYQEPLACSMLEAMAMGLLVIGTTTGGSGELLVHGQTGLAFEAGDPQSLAIQLRNLSSNPDMTEHLASAGQRLVREHYGIGITVDKVERYLLGLTRN
jgi:glycosyltransferase involved in cell wall biosynthesis